MAYFSLPYSIVLFILGSIFIIRPEKVAWLRKVLKKGDTSNIEVSQDLTNLFRLLGIIGFIVGLYGVLINI